MLWFFGGVEIGIISLISGGFYLKQDGSFGWKAKKLCFWGFFNFQPKRPSSIKNGLRTLFFIIRTNYGSNAVKNGLVVLSQCCLEVCVWHRNWKVQNLDKYIAFPIVFGTLCFDLVQEPSLEKFRRRMLKQWLNWQLVQWGSRLALRHNQKEILTLRHR